MRKLRVMALMHQDLVPPDNPEGVDLASVEWKTEFDVLTTLTDLGHDVTALGVRDDLRVIDQVVNEWKPHIAFNLLEEFNGNPEFDQNVVSYLELLGVSYTGCNPKGLVLTRDKGWSKKIMAYHGIRCPHFVVFPLGRAIKWTGDFPFPVIVKSISEEASLGISQASIVHDEDKLKERVEFVHQQVGTSAIVERYIEGRELYVGVLGNRRLQVLPVWELDLKNLPPEALPIATARVKWSVKYQKKYHIQSGEVEGLSPKLVRAIQRTAKRAYHILGLNGYARMDFRLDCQNRHNWLMAKIWPNLPNAPVSRTKPSSNVF